MIITLNLAYGTVFKRFGVTKFSPVLRPFCFLLKHEGIASRSYSSCCRIVDWRGHSITYPGLQTYQLRMRRIAVSELRNSWKYRNHFDCRGHVQTPGRCFPPLNTRGAATLTSSISKRHRTVLLYITALAVFVGGASYAAVPLYRMYCQASGLGGTVKIQDVGEKIEKMEKQEDRKLTIRFNADTSSTLQWNFRPQQTQVKIVPGETALAFYTAKNPTDQPVTGVSTYNVIPFDAGQYFNKIQCFCFEEQRLNPHEEVDMPVFFYIDPEFTEDPAMIKVDTITLSYTFFEAKEGVELPLPGH